MPIGAEPAAEEHPAGADDERRINRVGHRKRRLEIAATVLLSAATVLTAWSAFESTKWSGVQAIRFSRASASRTDSVRASNGRAADRGERDGLHGVADRD